MKKKIISAAAVLVLTIGTCSAAMASDTGGPITGRLKSHGAIVYEDADSEVVINSLDLYMLAEQADQTRANVAKQLGKMHTFFTTGQGTALKNGGRIGVSYTEPSGKDFVDPLTLDLNTLVEGIAASQRFSSDVRDYGYPAGTILYQKADGTMTTHRGTENLPELHIKMAKPENLSAGTAAWVNGELILGTGTDNQTYMEKGKSAAAADGAGNLGSIFQNFNTVGGWMGGFHGTLPYTFTPGKSVLMVFDGPLDATFDGANLPDSAVTGTMFSMFYWQNNQHPSIKVKVQSPQAGFNAILLLKEW